MPKNKSHKGLLRRVKITASGKLKHKRSGTSHLMSSFSGKRKRQHRNARVVSRPVAKKMESLLHRRLKGRKQG